MAAKSQFRRKFMVSFEVVDTMGMLDKACTNPVRFDYRASDPIDIKRWIREALSVKSKVFLNGLTVKEAPAVLPKRKAKS